MTKKILHKHLPENITFYYIKKEYVRLIFHFQNAFVSNTNLTLSKY